MAFQEGARDNPTAEREEGSDMFTIAYRYLSSPRVVRLLKWAAISGVSVGVCVVALHYYVKSQNNALRNALKSSIDALKDAVETENSVLISTVERQNQVIQAEHETISTLFQALERRVLSENQTVQHLLETIQKLTEQNAKSIEQLSKHQRLAADAIQAAQKSSEAAEAPNTSIQNQIGSTVIWAMGKGVGLAKGLFTGWW